MVLEEISQCFLKNQENSGFMRSEFLSCRILCTWTFTSSRQMKLSQIQKSCNFEEQRIHPMESLSQCAIQTKHNFSDKLARNNIPKFIQIVLHYLQSTLLAGRRLLKKKNQFSVNKQLTFEILLLQKYISAVMGY